jgi:hypothetical protein
MRPSFDNGSTDPVDALIGMGCDWYFCNLFNCNPFSIASSMMGNQAQPSIVKLTECNWYPQPLTSCSRNNLKIQLSISKLSLCYTTYQLHLARILNYGSTLSSFAEFAMNLRGWFCIEYFRL